MACESMDNPPKEHPEVYKYAALQLVAEPSTNKSWQYFTDSLGSSMHPTIRLTLPNYNTSPFTHQHIPHLPHVPLHSLRISLLPRLHILLRQLSHRFFELVLLQMGKTPHALHHRHFRNYGGGLRGWRGTTGWRWRCTRGNLLDAGWRRLRRGVGWPAPEHRTASATGWSELELGGMHAAEVLTLAQHFYVILDERWGLPWVIWG